MDKDTVGAIELIPGKLFYVSLRHVPRSSERSLYFTLDHELVYMRFFNDFGPMNLSQTYRFCAVLRQKLQDAGSRPVYYYTSTDPQRKANAACLLCIYLVLVLGVKAEDAYAPFARFNQNFIPYRDASMNPCTFNLTILDCLKALEKAKKLNWIDLPSFNLTEYEFFERVENGDMNWILPGKFLAFSGPQGLPPKSGFRTHPPEFYIPTFKNFGITAVVRLNNKCYERRRFVDAGIRHYDLYFPDGSTPPDQILARFLEISEKESGAIAVHCKAGLGRTGTLIACYIMKHYDFTPSEVIGWIRLCRPGSVIGPQQHYLQSIRKRICKDNEMDTTQLVAAHPLKDEFDGYASDAASSYAKMPPPIARNTPTPGCEVPILPPSVSRRPMSTSVGEFPTLRKDTPTGISRQNSSSITPESTHAESLKNRSNGDLPMTKGRMPQITPTRGLQTPNSPGYHTPVISRSKIPANSTPNTRSTSVPYRGRGSDSTQLFSSSTRRY